MTYVKNANGTSRWVRPSTGESSWLEYWKQHRTGDSTIKCGCCGVTYNLVGAHVQKVNGGNELISHHFATVATNKRETFLLIQNSSGYQATFN